jgi:hypothetical protein
METKQTQEQLLSEMEKCKEDIVYFAENYCTINNQKPNITFLNNLKNIANKTLTMFKSRKGNYLVWK